MLDLITPVILTYNEAPNIGRSLERLRWAKDVVIVDSHSSDETIAIAREFPNVRVLERSFDSHEGQWSFALTQTGIKTEWVLRLDADYILTQELIDEIAKLEPTEAVAGYRIAFTYCVFGRPLRASLYPPNSILFRRQRVSCRQDGHTERWDVEGEVLPLEGRALHDDRKSVDRWVLAQARYLARERDKFVTADPAPRTSSSSIATVPTRPSPLHASSLMFVCWSAASIPTKDNGPSRSPRPVSRPSGSCAWTLTTF